MQMLIHCPHCDAQLSVPEKAAGHPGRCPSCKARFRVPDEQQLLEDTVGEWIEEEVEAEEEEDDQPAPPTGHTPASRQGTPHREQRERTVDESHAAATPASTAPSRSEPKSGSPGASEPAAAHRRQSDGKQVYEVRSAVRSGRQPPPRSQSYEPGVALPKGAPPAASPSGDGTRPYLDVISTSAAGVRIGFEAHLLKRLAFRASMPMHCMACETEEKTKLMARPVIWFDKATGHQVSPDQLEAQYEHQVHAGQNVVDVVKSLPTIDELPPPINEPIPYFVCHNCDHEVRVSAEAVMSSGGLRCELMIPVPHYATEWVGRVNGICGDEYLQLVEKLSSFNDENWQALEERVRNRISAWFEPQLDERFVAYYRDSDFPVKDNGLAGFVLTDRRLVYCKYHRHGSISLDRASVIEVIPDGRFCDIKGPSGRKTLRLRREDAEHLAEQLRQLDRPLQIRFAE